MFFCGIILSIASEIEAEATVLGTLGELGTISMLSAATIEVVVADYIICEEEADDDNDGDELDKAEYSGGDEVVEWESKVNEEECAGEDDAGGCTSH